MVYYKYTLLFIVHSSEYFNKTCFFNFRRHTMSTIYTILELSFFVLAIVLVFVTIALSKNILSIKVWIIIQLIIGVFMLFHLALAIILKKSVSTVIFDSIICLIYGGTFFLGVCLSHLGFCITYIKDEEINEEDTSTTEVSTENCNK